MLKNGEKSLLSGGDIGKNPGNLSFYGYIFFSVFFSIYVLAVALDLGLLFFILLTGILLIIIGFYAVEYILFLIPIILSNPLGLKQTGTNLILSEYILLILFGIYFIQFFIHKKEYYFPKNFLIPSIILVISAIGSLLSAKYPYYGVLQVVRFIEVLIVFFFVVINICSDQKCIERVVLSILIGGGISAVIGLYQFISETSHLGYSIRAYGLLGAGFGAVLSSVLMFCIGILLYEKKRIIRLFTIAIFPVALVSLLLSQTRAWIGSFVLVLLFLIVWKSRIKIKKLALFAAVAVLTLIVLITTNIFGLVDQSIFDTAIKSAFRFGPRAGVYSVEDISLFLRATVWIYAVGLFIQNPIFGIGIGNLRFANYLPPQLGAPSPELGFVDNQFIHFFAEIGVLGGVAWIVYLFNAMRTGSKNLDMTAGTNMHAIAFGLYGSLAVFIVGSLFWVITPSHELFAFMIMLVALTVSLNRVQGRSAE